MEKTHRKNASRLYKLAIELGGVLIKLCQFFSTRRDIFPAAYIDILSPLQDKVPPVHFSEIEMVLKEEYGDPYRFFSSIDNIPVASASLGQTHRATLIDGTSIILKIQKPKIEQDIDTDFAIMHIIFSLFSKLKAFKDKRDMLEILDQFISVTGDELNFQREAEISRKFYYHYRNIDYLKIPYIYSELSGRRIIAMEFVNGDKISEIEKWSKRNNDPILISKRLIEFYYEQFMELGTVHYDPHPGNILITDNNNITIIDYGMAGDITEAMQRGIKDGLSAFITKDYNKMITILTALGFIKKEANRGALITVLEYFFEEVVEAVRLERESIQGIDLTPVIEDLIDLIYSQPITLPVEWAYIGRTTGTLTGIISSLNPGINIYHELKPYTERILHKNLDQIISEAKKFIVNNGKTLLELPGRVEWILKQLERGKYRFKVDFEEVDEKIDDLKSTLVRSASLGIGVVFGGGSYLLYATGQLKGAIIFAAISLSSIFYSFLYRKVSAKGYIRKKISKQ